MCWQRTSFHKDGKEEEEDVEVRENVKNGYIDLAFEIQISKEK